MLSALFESQARHKSRKPSDSPFSTSYTRTKDFPYHSPRHSDHRAVASIQENDDSKASSSESSQDDNPERMDVAEELDHNENEDEETSPLLPIFDSTHLDTLPIYSLTHSIKLSVESRCETVLTWEQLCSPQVSQFLLKPLQKEITTNNFSACTVYCLMANCLQFTKESAIYPGNSGTCSTRALICELLAIRLLRDYTTRGLIDTLSYDFDPLQGHSSVDLRATDHRPSWPSVARRYQPRSVRISTMEIAIRAQAKRFLAHPVVVQQLEAIWNGTIVFHAAADNDTRRRGRIQHSNYGTTGTFHSAEISSEREATAHTGTRKVVTLYNPRDASLFKLSRLRVPRYRHILSTFSFAILLGLFVAVLSQRSLHITGLEVFFWFWAAGFMLGPLIGFTEQGFGLYLASFWNTMDLGILLILFAHLCLRVYGILMPAVRKRDVANMAFDVLAADAILLFPRLFSVLDHYRYFSQLIIAFRLMTADLVAVFVLIVISCSGFFVAMTLSFGSGRTDTAPEVAYALLQMILGFTPAVWDRWDTYTPLGRTIMVGFVCLCHFLILTILITVLTNSFMAVVKNAHEEHQFIFAVNTISSVKSDALFSYVPPLNVLQWILGPLRYTLPFKQYLKINRTVIKATHLPILFVIYAYEKVILQSEVIDSIDAVERRRHARSVIAQGLNTIGRERPIVNYRQDQALEEVFKKPFNATHGTGMRDRRKNSSTVVNKWMHDMDGDSASTPEEDDPRKVDRLERRRLGERSLSSFSRLRKSSRKAQSLASDPADLTSNAGFFSPQPRTTSGTTATTPSGINVGVQEDTADGDDEMLTNEDDGMTTDTRDEKVSEIRSVNPGDYFSHHSSPSNKRTAKAGSTRSTHSSRERRGTNSGYGSPLGLSIHRRPITHMRNVSSATMIFNPRIMDEIEASRNENLRLSTSSHSRPSSNPMTPGSKQASSGRKSPKTKLSPRVRPNFPPKGDHTFRSTPNLSGMTQPGPSEDQHRASLEMDLVSDLGDNKAIGGGYVGAIPASFASQLAYTSGSLQVQKERTEEQQMFGRLMMTRMNTLEEGFRDVIHEMRESLNSASGSRNRSPERPAQLRRERRAATRKETSKDKTSSSSNENDGSGASTLLVPNQSDRSIETTSPTIKPTPSSQS